ncbi:hypothetical protein M3Y98_01009100 [Aphelenchoides besseyi]|nr:hypothetical protein M3Y98_01009100 [Aphelenchoides besseyi]
MHVTDRLVISFYAGALYFYVSFEKHAKKWNIFGFAVDQKSLKWEFVGGLDIEIDNVRLVDIRTLAYEDFKTPDFPFTELTNHVRSAHFQHTSHGTYLFVYAHFSNGPTFKSIDEIFTMDVDSVGPTGIRKTSKTDKFTLNALTCPNCPQKIFILIMMIDFLILDTQNDALIDYFGDLYVINWQATGPLSWTKFSITGCSYRPASDKRDISAAAEDAGEYWVLSTSCIMNSNRFFLKDGFVYEDTYPDGLKILYRLNFQFETLSCECTEIFRTKLCWVDDRDIIMLVNNHDGSRMLMFRNRFYRMTEPFAWELLFVGQVPKLKHLAYWAVRSCLRPKTGSRLASALNTTITRLIRILRVKRRKTAKENSNWPEKKSSLLANPKDIVSRVSRSQIIYLLKKFPQKLRPSVF